MDKLLHPDHPVRRRGKSALRITYTWGLAPGHAVMHLFQGLTGQAGGVSMCGQVQTVGPITPGLFGDVCGRCRERSRGHPLPRGML